MINSVAWLWLVKVMLVTIVFIAATVKFVRWRSGNLNHRPIAIMTIIIVMALAADFILAMLYYPFHPLMIIAGSSFGSLYVGMLIVVSSHIYMNQIFYPTNFSLWMLVYYNVVPIITLVGYIVLKLLGYESIQNVSISVLLTQVGYNPIALWWFLCFIAMCVHIVYFNISTARQLIMRMDSINLKGNFHSVQRRQYLYVLIIYILFMIAVPIGIIYLVYKLNVQDQAICLSFYTLILYLIFVFSYLHSTLTAGNNYSGEMKKVDSLGGSNEADLSNLNLSASDRALIERIEILMNEQHIYTMSNISAEGLAVKVGVSRKKLYLIISEYYKMSFVNFINSSRLNYAEKLLLDKDNETISILEISEKAGFNSFSTFNNYFKAKFGTTPAKYRRQL